jgi:hypothetical protein
MKVGSKAKNEKYMREDGSKRRGKRANRRRKRRMKKGKREERYILTIFSTCASSFSGQSAATFFGTDECVRDVKQPAIVVYQQQVAFSRR